MAVSGAAAVLPCVMLWPPSLVWPLTPIMPTGAAGEVQSSRPVAETGVDDLFPGEQSPAAGDVSGPRAGDDAPYEATTTTRKRRGRLPDRRVRGTAHSSDSSGPAPADAGDVGGDGPTGSLGPAPAATSPSAGAAGGQQRYRGVWLDRKRGKYKTRIWISGRTVFLGSHADEVDAARAYDKVAINRTGPQAATNFPTTDYDVDDLMATPLAELVAEMRGQASRGKVELQPAAAGAGGGKAPRGVSRQKGSGKWAARLTVRGQASFLGLFDSQEEAQHACAEEAARLGVPAPALPGLPGAGGGASMPDIMGLSDVPATPRMSGRRHTPSARSLRARGLDDDEEWRPHHHTSGAKKARHGQSHHQQRQSPVAHDQDGDDEGIEEECVLHHRQMEPVVTPVGIHSGPTPDGHQHAEQEPPLSPQDAAVTLMQLLRNHSG